MKAFRLILISIITIALIGSFTACKNSGESTSSDSSTAGTASTPTVSSNAGSTESVQTSDTESSGTGNTESTPESSVNQNSSSDNSSFEHGFEDGSSSVNSSSDATTGEQQPQNKPTISMVSEKSGKRITLKIKAANNPGVATFKLLIGYDKTAVSPVSITNGAVSVTSNLQQSTNLNGKVTALYVDAVGTSKNGTLFSVAFDVKDNASGDISFTLTSDGDFLNKDFGKIDFSLLGTTVKIN